MGNFQYYNPVKVFFGKGESENISSLIKGKKILLCIDSFFSDHVIVEQITKYAYYLAGIITVTKPNPTFDEIRLSYRKAWQYDFDIIIALGGGSVIDTAKVISVFHNSKDFNYVETLIRDLENTNNYSFIPIIAIPTTAGTGSDVTPWATVWDANERKKYSLHHKYLWIKYSINDPLLTLSLPRIVTIQTSLDALSHALESIWNKNANPVSTLYAIEACKIIINNLPDLINDTTNYQRREKIMLGALFAGFAFSNTQTAIAHAISYYLTANYNLAHGLACSLTLPDIIDTVKHKDTRIDQALHGIFNEVSSNKLRNFFSQIGVSTSLSTYLNQSTEIDKIKQSIIGNERFANAVIDIDDLFDRLSGNRG